MTTPSAFAVLAAVGACALTSAYFRRDLSDERQPLPSFQPRPVAFSIWFALFLIGAGHGVLLLFLPSRAASESSWWYAASFLVAASWPLLYSRRMYAASSFAVLLSCVLSLTSLIVFDLGSYSSDGRTVLYRVGPGMLFGWLAIASALSLVLAGFDSLDHPTTLITASSLVSGIALAFRQPYACLPVLWACALHRDIAPYAALSAALATLCALGAAARTVS